MKRFVTRKLGLFLIIVYVKESLTFELLSIEVELYIVAVRRMKAVVRYTGEWKGVEEDTFK